MRDKNKNIEYFDNSINRLYLGISKREEKLKNGLIKKDRLQSVKKSMTYQYLSILKLKYSRGDNMFSEEVIDDLKELSILLDSYWQKNNLNILYYLDKKKPVYLNQYSFQSHLDFIDILSLGVLLDLQKDYFQLISNFIENDNIKDFLYDFLISYKIKSRKPFKEENFQEFTWYKDKFPKLKEIIHLENKELAQKKLKIFLEKDWYNILKDSLIYNQHNVKNGNYLGYWCFVAAAIVKIKELDDTEFRDNQYYPKDLVSKF